MLPRRAPHANKSLECVYHTPITDSGSRKSSFLSLDTKNLSDSAEINSNTTPCTRLTSADLKATLHNFIKDSLIGSIDDLFQTDILDKTLESTYFKFAAITSATLVDPNLHVFSLQDNGPQFTGHGKSLTRRGAELGYRTKRSRIVHRSSCISLPVGKVWIRKSTHKLGAGFHCQGGKLELVNSIIIYPSNWLIRIGMSYAAEAQFRMCPLNGFAFQISPIHAVPDDALIFQFCRMGNKGAVRVLLEEGRASVRDTNSRGYTPLHVSYPVNHLGQPL